MGIFDGFLASFGYYPIPPSVVSGLSSENAALTEKIKTANDLIFQLQKSDDGKAQKIIEQEEAIAQMHMSISAISAQLQDASNAIDNLKSALAQNSEVTTTVPVFLDEEGEVYLPRIQTIAPDGKIGSITIENPRDMFAVFDLQRRIVTNKKWRNLTRYQKIMAVWTFICDPNTKQYLADMGDNWQLALITLIRKLGDCEDTSILLVTICRLLGILGSEVFLAVGPTTFGYHAYPIAWLYPDDVKEFNATGSAGWYIFESTLSGIPTKPKALLGSNYWIDGGLMNWEHVGSIRSAYLAQFNGLRPGSAPGAEMDQVIDNSKEKRMAIQKHWEDGGNVKKR